MDIDFDNLVSYLVLNANKSEGLWGDDAKRVCKTIFEEGRKQVAIEREKEIVKEIKYLLDQMIFIDMKKEEGRKKGLIELKKVLEKGVK